MPTVKSTLAAVAVPDKLRRRDRQAVALAAEIAVKHGAFSISFDFHAKLAHLLRQARGQGGGGEQGGGEPEADGGQGGRLGAAAGPGGGQRAARRGTFEPALRHCRWRLKEQRRAIGRRVRRVRVRHNLMRIGRPFTPAEVADRRSAGAGGPRGPGVNQRPGRGVAHAPPAAPAARRPPRRGWS